MANLSGIRRALVRLAKGIKDEVIRRAVMALEDKIDEMDRRLVDTETRLDNDTGPDLAIFTDTEDG